jgi:hypothetical protein
MPQSKILLFRKPFIENYALCRATSDSKNMLPYDKWRKRNGKLAGAAL